MIFNPPLEYQVGTEYRISIATCLAFVVERKAGCYCNINN